MTTGAVDMALGWQWLSNAQRAAVKADYKNAGINLLVSAFGATGALVSSSATNEEADLCYLLADIPTTDRKSVV